MFDRPAKPGVEKRLRVGRVVAAVDSNTETPGLECYVSTFSVKFVDAGFDEESETPTLSLADRGPTTVTAVAPAGANPVPGQTVILFEYRSQWWILQEYCDSVTYFPDQDCDPHNCAPTYFPDYSGDCDGVPEFGWGVDFGTWGLGCCGGNASGVVCLTNDEAGEEWRSVIFDCEESETAYWALNTELKTLKLVEVSSGDILVQYELIAAEWCCMCSNEMRLSCPPDNPCATDWPKKICVKPNTEFCQGGDDCNYADYEFTTTVSGFSGGTGGCCGDYNGTWVIAYQSPNIWVQIKPSTGCDASDRFAAITQLSASLWQLSFQPTFTGDIVTYTAPALSCTDPTEFTRVSSDCGAAPATVTVTPSLA